MQDMQPSDSSIILRAVFEHTDPILIADNQGRYLDANPAACELFGTSRAAITGKSVFDFVKPEDIKATKETWDTFRKSKKMSGEFVLRRPDGSSRILEYSAVAGIAPGLNVSLLRDVTVRRATAKELEGASEEGFRQLAENMPQIVWVVNSSGATEYINSQWTGITGASAESFSSERWADLVHPEDREFVGRQWSDALATGKVFEAEYRLKYKDGNYQWHLARSVPIRDPSGKLLRWLGTSTNINHQKETQRALARAEEYSKFLAEAGTLLASSLDYKETFASIARLAVSKLADWCAIDIKADEDSTPESVAVMHHDPGKIELAKELNRKYPPDWSARTGVPNVIRTGVPELYTHIPDEFLVAGTRDAEHLRLSRELGLKSAMIVPLKSRGKTLGAITFIAAEKHGAYTQEDLVLAEDLGRRAGLAADNALLYKKAQDAIEALEKSNQDLERFASIAAHDLKSPLHSMTRFSEVLMRKFKGNLGAEGEEFLGFIVDTGKRANTLVESLLNFARAGKESRPLKRVDLNKIVDEVIANLKTALQESGMEIQRGPLPSVLGDEVQLGQLFQNLLANAVKFRAKQDPQIKIRAQVSSESIRLEVQDNGIGVPTDKVDGIFEIFKRAHDNRYEGAGLGLSICKKIVERHGGTISVKSKVSHGTTFLITFPLADEGKSLS